ncbi:MAG: hypothetical protein WBC91_01465 [Phototrophicaceae bacterium]
MLDDSKSINAKDITKNPDDIFAMSRPYILVRDESITGSFSELMDALHILKDAGWNAIQMSFTGTSMMVLVENTNYKRKLG